MYLGTVGKHAARKGTWSFHQLRGLPVDYFPDLGGSNQHMDQGSIVTYCDHCELVMVSMSRGFMIVIYCYYLLL